MRSRWVLLFGPNTWLTLSSTVPAWLALGTAQRSSDSLTHVAFTRSLPQQGVEVSTRILGKTMRDVVSNKERWGKAPCAYPIS